MGPVDPVVLFIYEKHPEDLDITVKKHCTASLSGYVPYLNGLIFSNESVYQDRHRNTPVVAIVWVWG